MNKTSIGGGDPLPGWYWSDVFGWKELSPEMTFLTHTEEFDPQPPILWDIGLRAILRNVISSQDEDRV